MGLGIRAGRAPRTLLLAVLGAGVGVMSGTASAQAANWQCSASVYRAALLGNTPSEPLAANSGFDPCVDGQAGPQNVAESAGLPASFLTATTASARTTIEPDSGPAAAQIISAAGRVENLALNLSQLPGGSPLSPTLNVRAVTARVDGACTGGAPTLTGASEVVGASVGGAPAEVPIQDAIDQINATLQSLGINQVVRVRLNEQVRDATSLTQRALQLTVGNPSDGSTALDLVVGEARGGANGAVCSSSGGPGGGSGGPGGGSGGPGGGGLPTGIKACPTGSELDLSSGFCVIRAAGGQGVLGERAIIVGRPFEGPVGGTVVALGEARKRYSSPCLRGRGPRFAVIGTKGADRITGSNKADRILSLAGRDRVDGGRGNDCVDGGRDRDVLSGALGRDRVYGQHGNDALNGGPSSDRLAGGIGSDTINAAFGADRITGGIGNDAVNVATAGPRARVNCGAGRDKARFNSSERRTVRRCEIRYVLPDKKR